MEMIDTNQFAELIASKGIVFDRQYPPPHALVYPTTTGIRVSLSDTIVSRERAIEACLGLLPIGSALWVYKRDPVWRRAIKSDPVGRRAYLTVLAAMGLREGLGTLFFPSEEKDAVQGLALLHSRSLSGADSDIFIIPEKGESHFLWVSHDEEIFIECAHPQCREIARCYLQDCRISFTPSPPC